MSGQRDAAHLADNVPSLSDRRRSGVLSDLEQLAVRTMQRSVGTSALAAPQPLTSIVFADPLDNGAPARTHDTRPPATTPTFIEPEGTP